MTNRCSSAAARRVARLASLLLVFAAVGAAQAREAPAAPLRVMLIPADGGTAGGTLADFQPLFNAVTRSTGLRFELRVGQSYSAVIEAMKNGMVEVAWLGPVAYVQAREAGAAELLAVAVLDGESVYYSGVFVRRESPAQQLGDLRGRRVAVGDLNSGSSFTYPMNMLLAAGLDPERDLEQIRITGSHAAALAALVEGHVDAACLSFDSFAKAANRGVIDAAQFRVLARSEPIPNPPLALSTTLPAQLKARLRAAFAQVHRAPGVSPEMIRGYGGVRVDRYDTAFPEARFDVVGAAFARVGEDVRAAVLRKAVER